MELASLKEEMLVIAGSLAVLTYYLGVLVYALPIPSLRMKRWAPILIQDGLTAFLLMVSFTAVIALIDYLRSLIGGDYDVLMDYILSLYMQALSAVVLVKYFATYLGSLGLSFASSVASPLLSAAMLLVSLLGLTALVASLVVNAKEILVAAGIMLYSLPFRMGRGAGASLLAFTIVAYTALPLLPQWSLFVTSAALSPPVTGGDSENLTRLGGCVEGVYGSPSFAAIKFRDTSSEDLEYTFIVGSTGCYNAGRPFKGIPSNKTYRVSLEYLGFDIGLKPEVVTIPQDAVPVTGDDRIDYRLDFNAPGVAFISNGVFVAIVDAYMVRVEKPDKNEYTIVVKEKNGPTSKFNVYIVSLSYCKPRIVATEDIIINSLDEGDFVWKDVPVHYVVVSASFNDTYSAKLRIHANRCPYRILPMIQESVVYAESFVSLSYAILAIVWYWTALFVSISSFLAIVASLTYGVAAFLGGRGFRVPIPI